MSEFEFIDCGTIEWVVENGKLYGRMVMAEETRKFNDGVRTGVQVVGGKGEAKKEIKIVGGKTPSEIKTLDKRPKQ